MLQYNVVNAIVNKAPASNTQFLFFILDLAFVTKCCTALTNQTLLDNMFGGRLVKQ